MKPGVKSFARPALRPATGRRSLSRADMGFAAVCTAVFSALAHLYRWMSAGFGLDAMMLVESVDIENQISLGRFMQPVYWLVRGYITSPPVVGLFATAFLALSALMVLDMTGVRSRAGIALTCGVLAANEALAVSYASYLPWVDVYMLAMLLAMLACWLQSRLRWGFLAAPVLYCLSMALYQSYLQAAVTTVILMLMARALEGEKPAHLLLCGIGHVLTLLAGMVLYSQAYKWAIALYGTQASQEYNGVLVAAMIQLEQVPRLLRETYLRPLAYLFVPGFGAFVPAWVNWLLLAAAALFAAVLARRVPRGSRALLALLAAMLPFGMNFVAFISKGVVHMLMNYAYVFFYILVVMLAERAAQAGRGRLLAAARPLAAVGVGAAVAVGCVSAQALYAKRDLELQSTLSVMTRVLERLEETPGYVAGETPVAILGYLPSSNMAMMRPGFEEISQYQGMRSTYADAYERSHEWYLRSMLGWNIRMVPWEECVRWQKTEKAQEIPLFPAEDCVQMIDGIVFIRLS